MGTLRSSYASGSVPHRALIDNPVEREVRWEGQTSVPKHFNDGPIVKVNGNKNTVIGAHIMGWSGQR